MEPESFATKPLGVEKAGPLKNKRSRKARLILAGVFFVIFLSSSGLLTYQLAYGSTAKARKTANEFMTAMWKGEVAQADKMASTENANQQARTDFLNEASVIVGGGYSLKQSEIRTTKGATFAYYLYDLKDVEFKSARVVLQKAGNSWKVAAFTYDPSQLNLIPEAP